MESVYSSMRLLISVSICRVFFLLSVCNDVCLGSPKNTSKPGLRVIYGNSRIDLAGLIEKRYETPRIMIGAGVSRKRPQGLQRLLVASLHDLSFLRRTLKDVGYFMHYHP